MRLARFTKQPIEQRRFVIDYSHRLQTGETIATIDGYDITPVSETTPLAVSASIGVANDNVVLYVSGGEDCIEYTLQVRVTTSDAGGVLWEDELIFEVEEI
jgi:hypothetical protein